jgi:hypothetical protein
LCSRRIFKGRTIIQRRERMECVRARYVLVKDERDEMSMLNKGSDSAARAEDSGQGCEGEFEIGGHPGVACKMTLVEEMT